MIALRRWRYVGDWRGAIINPASDDRSALIGRALPTPIVRILPIGNVLLAQSARREFDDARTDSLSKPVEYLQLVIVLRLPTLPLDRVLNEDVDITLQAITEIRDWAESVVLIGPTFRQPARQRLDSFPVFLVATLEL